MPSLRKHEAEIHVCRWCRRARDVAAGEDERQWSLRPQLICTFDMNHTYELRVHRRGHRLKQEELAHLLGVTPSMIVRMEQGAKAQVACLELVIGLEVVFGKPLSQTLAALHTHVEDAMLRNQKS